MLIWVLSIITSCAWAGAEISVKIEIKQGGPKPEIVHESKLKELELGAEIAAVIVEGRDAQEVVVSQRYETSLTVSGEGPHLDFTDWKHGHTDWVDLKKEHGKFTADKRIDYDAKKPFPKVTQREILDHYEIFKKKYEWMQTQSHWDDEVKKCKTADTSPCSVGTSAVEFQLKKKKPSGEFEIIRTLRISIPMGC
jgi:hypothetical protein